MKRSDLDLMELVQENISVRTIRHSRVGELVVDIYRDRSTGKYYQAQPPLQGKLYRATAGLGELADYGDWLSFQE